MLSNYFFFEIHISLYILEHIDIELILHCVKKKTRYLLISTLGCLLFSHIFYYRGCITITIVMYNNIMYV